MDFTGERYVPSETGLIRYEHMHRYAWCLSAINHLDVLDIACGAGYGSALMATKANRVVGVDISEEAVAFAKQTYSAYRNLSFLVGDAACIPLDDRSFDVIVSFETIEHLVEQDKMLSEIRRVLRPDGFLIISSPNKNVYSDKHNDINVFHKKELDFQEFNTELMNYFYNVKYFCQRRASASFIYPNLNGEQSAKTAQSNILCYNDKQELVEERAPNFVDPVYFIAIASTQPLQSLVSEYSLFAADEDPLTHELRALSDAVVERDNRIAELYRANEMSAAQIEAISKNAAASNEAVVERDGRLAELYKANAESQMLIDSLNFKLTTFAEAEAFYERQLHDVKALTATLQSKEAIVSERSDLIVNLLKEQGDQIASLGASFTSATMRANEVNETLTQLQTAVDLFSADLATTNSKTDRLSQEISLYRIEAAAREQNMNSRLNATFWSRVGKAMGKIPLLLTSSNDKVSKADSETAQKSLAELVRNSRLFDLEYYLHHNADVAQAGVDPIIHYLTSGGFEGRNPNASFDSAWYLAENKDVADAGLNPLVHYIRHGQAEGRLPNSHFTWFENQTNGSKGGRLSFAERQLRRLLGIKPQRHDLGPALLSSIAASMPLHARQFFDRLDAYESWRWANARTSAADQDLRQNLNDRKARLEKISLITPVYNTPEPLLRELVDSVLKQIYSNWELCLVDDASPSKHVRPLLQELAALDNRILLIARSENGGISAATNSGVEAATGSIVAFLDHDDLISPDCLGEIALYYADNPSADIVYSDDDKIDLHGGHFAPQFKPDWSPVLLLSYMYLSHIFTVRRDLFLQIGGFRAEFDGSQDYDFALRASEKARHVGHVPRILYHWRVVPGSTAQSGDAKPASFEAGRKAVEQALGRRGIDAKVIHPSWAVDAKVGMFSVIYPDTGPSVTIIIPNYNNVSYLKTCIDSINNSTYKNFDVLIADNDSNDSATLSYLETIKTRFRHRVINIHKKEGKFNFSSIVNQAVKAASTEFVLLLNNDTKVIDNRWLSQMMGLAQHDGVGAVGARLYFDDQTIQHAGIVHGYHEGLVGHAFRNASPHDWGYMGFIRTAREYSAVTAACLLVSREVYNTIGGFDEASFAVAYNDVDFCYRVVMSGLRCIYCADAQLFHYEGKSRPKRDNPNEVKALRDKYSSWRDLWYNSNLSLENESFEPGAIRLPIRRDSPIRVAFVTHNLNYEGAPNTLLDLVIGLTQERAVEAIVLSPSDGPLRRAYEDAGISVSLFDPPPLNNSPTEFRDGCLAIGQKFVEFDADVVVANTLQMFFIITAAELVNIGSIWCQHESEPWQNYFNYVAAGSRGYAYAAFGQAYRVTYVATATKHAWSELETRRNFRVIRHGIPPVRLKHELSKWKRDDARTSLNVTMDEVVVLLAGTVCERKGQSDLVEAFSQLSDDTQRRIRVLIVGAFGESSYHEKLEKLIQNCPNADRIVITGAVDDITKYFSAADIYVCTSRIESAPRVIVEAMAFGLPILTTPVFGIPELVDEGSNALFYSAGDSQALAQLVVRLVENDNYRREMAQNSLAVFASKPGYKEMMAGYRQIIREAALLKGRYISAHVD